MCDLPAPIPPTQDFLDALASLHIQLEPGELEHLGLFLAMLFEANHRFNLTRITDPAEAWRKHVLDSLTLLPLIASAGAKSVVDVGSGAGLPGAPLAITMPQVNFTLLETTGKKARFLEEVSSALGLKNASVVNERAEVFGCDVKAGREKFDIAIARAVGPLAVLLELMIPLVKPGGIALAVKGAKAHEEIKAAAGALKALHSQVVDLHNTPTGTVIIIRKLKATPRQYPRAPGEPKRKPLR